MVLSGAQRLLLARGLVAANGSPDGDPARWVISCFVLLSGLLSWAVRLPAQASPVSIAASTVSLPQRTVIVPKGEQIDKSTRRFEQARFEQRRLEADFLRQLQLEQARIEHLRRLQAYLDPAPSQLAPTNAISSSTAIYRSANGVYLYGQRSVPDQAATTYFVFELQDGSITGTFYMPSSSFDCVQGQMTPEQILLSVTDSYSQETSPYALRLGPPAAVVAGQPSSIATPPNIAGFYPLPVSDQSRELLATCQASY